MAARVEVPRVMRDSWPYVVSMAMALGVAVVPAMAGAVRATALLALACCALAVAGNVRAARAAARRELLLAQAQAALGAVHDSVVAVDARASVSYVNAAAERLLGQPATAVRGCPVDAVAHFVEPGTHRVVPHPVHVALCESRQAPLSPGAVLLRRDHREVPVEASALPLRGMDARAAVLVVRDVGRERSTAERLDYQQAHDALTGLLNRAEFEQRVASCLASPTHALLFVDLDQFRVVNQTCGHEGGDAMLRQVAAALQEQLRSSDAVARLGADEFGILLGECAADDALRVADKLCQVLAQARFGYAGRSFPMAVSVGVVELGAGWSAASAALDAAEAACGLAKEYGRNRAHLHRPGDVELALRDGMLQWVARIRDALDHGRLRLYAQRIVPAAPGDADGVHQELLLRMLDEHGQVVSPMAFLPAAERFGLITSIDRWVVRAAFERLGSDGPAGPSLCAINLSAASLCDERFLEFVLVERERCGVRPERVCFEITETAVISHFHKALRCIERLRELGFRFALDDFGTGMSSFAYLKRLPVDFLKIDGSFVKDMLHDPVDFAMVESINHIGHVMGLRTVAEFVEHDEARRRLDAIGVDFVQGYGIGRPEPF